MNKLFPELVLFPFVYHEGSWSIIRKLMVQLGLWSWLNYLVTELSTNFGVIGNFEDCTQIRNVALEVRERDPSALLRYVAYLTLRYFRERKSRYEILIDVRRLS